MGTMEAVVAAAGVAGSGKVVVRGLSCRVGMCSYLF